MVAQYNLHANDRQQLGPEAFRRVCYGLGKVISDDRIFLSLVSELVMALVLSLHARTRTRTVLSRRRTLRAGMLLPSPCVVSHPSGGWTRVLFCTPRCARAFASSTSSSKPSSCFRSRIMSLNATGSTHPHRSLIRSAKGPLEASVSVLSSPSFMPITSPAFIDEAH